MVSARPRSWHYLLAIAAAGAADFLVTGDNRRRNDIGLGEGERIRV
jgi:predicted nucleic acid-binding protein